MGKEVKRHKHVTSGYSTELISSSRTMHEVSAAGEKAIEKASMAEILLHLVVIFYPVSQQCTAE